ncbi:MAG: cyclic pyranopterin monophosphate synthase MoaC [Methanosarcinaceae archaeon]|nr:cyclic pyranopterin monophosphate synthase MoaC [Methanosarcinaceae archaeon]MDF1533232.1 cyclic pyranopterin monophosphate synthase MoaC [Methanosarcinaceae archaeon]
MTKEFTHIVGDRVRMVDISEKGDVVRRAVASGEIMLTKDTIEKIRAGDVEKGNVLATATTAAILAVKNTPQTIPMCHQIPITGIDVDFSIGESSITTEVEVRTVGKTGVEMEALTGVSTALLTIWDMVKSVEKDDTGNYPDTMIKNIRVVEKYKATKTNVL